MHASCNSAHPDASHVLMGQTECRAMHQNPGNQSKFPVHASQIIASSNTPHVPVGQTKCRVMHQNPGGLHSWIRSYTPMHASQNTANSVHPRAVGQTKCRVLHQNAGGLQRLIYVGSAKFRSHTSCHTLMLSQIASACWPKHSASRCIPRVSGPDRVQGYCINLLVDRTQDDAGRMRGVMMKLQI